MKSVFVLYGITSDTAPGTGLYSKALPGRMVPELHTQLTLAEKEIRLHLNHTAELMLDPYLTAYLGHKTANTCCLSQ